MKQPLGQSGYCVVGYMERENKRTLKIISLSNYMIIK